MLRSLAALLLFLPLAACDFVGPGEPCDEENNCAPDLACYEGYCSGRGTLPSGSQCIGDNECTPGTICFENQVCMGIGALRFTMKWQANTDYDIHVRAPTEEEIYYLNPRGSDLVLDLDDCIGGNCAAAFSDHRENIVSEEQVPLPGQYEVWIVNYDDVVSAEASLEIVYQNQQQDYREFVVPAEGNPGEPWGETEHLFFTVPDDGL